MTFASLVKGLALLLLLLLGAGLGRGIGSVELLIWLTMVIAWIAWWSTRRIKAGAAS
jgi:hypothetical protein